MQTSSFATLEEISKYRAKNTGAYLVIDTNILLLLLVGSYNINYIKDCPLMTENGKNYTIEHYNLLNKVIERFLNRVCITPHVLSEISSLSTKKIKQPHFDNYFTKLIEELSKHKEVNIDLKFLLTKESVRVFGFTDISLVEIVKRENFVLLTDEFKLYRTFSTDMPIIYFSKVISAESLKV